MSIDIYIKAPSDVINMHTREKATYHKTDMNMANANATELFRWLGLDVDDLWDVKPIAAHELFKACEERLCANPLVAAVAAAFDGGVDPSSDGRIIYGGRRPGYFRDRTMQLRDICEQAMELHEDAEIYWG